MKIEQYLADCSAALRERRIQKYSVWMEASGTTIVRIKDNENHVIVYTLDPETIDKFVHGDQDWWLVMSGATVEQLQSEYDLAHEEDMPDRLKKYGIWRQAYLEERH